jgi:hypothetical protein
MWDDGFYVILLGGKSFGIDKDLISYLFLSIYMWVVCVIEEVCIVFVCVVVVVTSFHFGGVLLHVATSSNSPTLRFLVCDYFNPLKASTCTCGPSISKDWILLQTK